MKTVLLIEDNNDIRENTVEFLELHGYYVLEAHNGKLGIALAKETIPNIILCDIMMPETDGYEVFNELRNDKTTLHIPFIFLTASVERKAVEKGFGMGASGYIRKPFDPEEILDTIKRCLTS